MGTIKLLLRGLGRLIFIALLLTSAVVKIRKPDIYREEVKNGYNNIQQLHPSLKHSLPIVNNKLLIDWD
jgi:hypothetical protein